MMVDEQSPWRKVSTEEARALRAHVLDCWDLDEPTIERVRKEFAVAGVEAVKTLTIGLGRAPTQTEVDALHASITAYFNKYRIAEIEREVSHA